MSHLGVAQLVARYLGVVEAASSSLVTQTKIRQSKDCRIFLCVSRVFEWWSLTDETRLQGLSPA